MDKKHRMKKISEKVGQDKAIQLVMHAYDTELLAGWLRHIDATHAGKMPRPERRDHLGNAVARVAEVCELTD
jgi:hypothetical protein